MPSLLTDVAGNSLTDASERETLITTFYEDLFDGSSDVLPDWIDDSFCPDDTPLINLDLLRFAIQSLACRKTC